jgi:hypothetical protein
MRTIKLQFFKNKTYKYNITTTKKKNKTQTFLMGGVPFLILSSNFMIFLSFCSSGDNVSSSTST